MDLAAYQRELDSWHESRVESLVGDNGWLNLAGLFWLQEGINTFGSDPQSQLVFPEGTIAGSAGYFLLKNGEVTMEVNPVVAVSIDGVRKQSARIFHPDSVHVPTVTHQRLQWFVIRRDNEFGIRLRNLDKPEVKAFKGIERYPVDPQWRIEATFQKTVGKFIDITNVMGQTVPQESPGTLVFERAGRQFSIDALSGGEEELFLIFADNTNGKETYPSGRYLYVTRPDSSNHVIIDFNRSINPPCAFTPYATCPLPPRQNILTITITAGEKNYVYSSANYN